MLIVLQSSNKVGNIDKGLRIYFETA